MLVKRQKTQLHGNRIAKFTPALVVVPFAEYSWRNDTLNTVRYRENRPNSRDFSSWKTYNDCPNKYHAGCYFIFVSTVVFKLRISFLFFGIEIKFFQYNFLATFVVDTGRLRIKRSIFRFNSYYIQFFIEGGIIDDSSKILFLNFSSKNFHLHREKFQTFRLINDYAIQ